MFNLDRFVSKYVIKREHSMFLDDLKANKDLIRDILDGKSVLVIGGAGSIGSSFIKAILRFAPGSLTVVDTNENGLAELTRDLRSSSEVEVPQEYIPYPMDYRTDAFVKMFRKHEGFDIVANFSAHKHVRSEKDVFAIEALLKNNVLDARKLLDLMKEFPPQCYFCVSTDKAANPVNIMGASKKIMEDLIFSYSDCFSVKTARFANVAFSNGSLPDGFLHRLSKLQPLSAPSDVKRYFVSMEESGQICMLSCMLAENREILFPKLKEQQMMTFDRIATDLLTEHGFKVEYCGSDREAIEKSLALKNGSNDYPVHFSESDTSGEKAFEEFFTDDENVDMDRFRSLGVVTGVGMPDVVKLNALLDSLERVFEKKDVKKDEIVGVIGRYLPEFNHIETGKSLDGKM